MAAACSGSSPCAREPVTDRQRDLRSAARRRAAHTQDLPGLVAGRLVAPAERRDMAMDRLLMLELAAGGCAVEVASQRHAAGGARPDGRQHQPGGPRIHAGRAQRADARGRPVRTRHDRAEPAARRHRADLGAGAPGARPPGPVAGRPGRRACSASPSGQPPRAAPTTRRRRTSARSIFRSTFRAGAGSMRRRSTSTSPVQAGHPRVPAAARGRARARQSRAADRRLEAALRRAGARVSDRRRHRRCSAFATKCSGCMLRKH